jgi:hypothetical protein
MYQASIVEHLLRAIMVMLRVIVRDDVPESSGIVRIEGRHIALNESCAGFLVRRGVLGNSQRTRHRER